MVSSALGTSSHRALKDAHLSPHTAQGLPGNLRPTLGLSQARHRLEPHPAVTVTPSLKRPRAGASWVGVELQPALTQGRLDGSQAEGVTQVLAGQSPSGDWTQHLQTCPGTSEPRPQTTAVKAPPSSQQWEGAPYSSLKAFSPGVKPDFCYLIKNDPTPIPASRPCSNS